jgi:hypothetical protein
MTGKHFAVIALSVLVLITSALADALHSSQVEESVDLGNGFRRITIAEPTTSEFESIGHFEYLFYRDQKIARLGRCSVSPSGNYAVFQEGPSGNLFAFSRADEEIVQLTPRFVALVDKFEWREDSGAVKVHFDTGAIESYSVHR